MGRAMIIICAGILVALGYVGIGTNQVAQRMTESNTGYAEFIQAKNSAHTVIQMAMQEMNEDSTWAEYYTQSNPWSQTVDGNTVELFVDVFYDAPNFWDPDSIRMVSTTTYGEDNDKTAEVVSVYLKNPFSDYVPTFKSPLSIATENFTLTSGGSAAISGYDASGQCSDKSAITVMNENRRDYADGETDAITMEGASPTIATDADLSYQPTDELIARLADTEDVQYLSGNYKGEMGTEDNPGVFFVEDPTSLTGGISEGYGILVVREDGIMSYDSSGVELDIAGNFTFNGLVIFENAYTFDGSGTPTINGSVLVGNTDDYDGTIDIDITGNLTMQYDCRGEDYAKKAAALAIKQNQYRRVVSYE